jgi:hypothetical protein
MWGVKEMNRNLENTIKRLGEKYKLSPKHLKIIIGQILEGNLKLKSHGEK